MKSVIKKLIFFNISFVICFSNVFASPKFEDYLIQPDFDGTFINEQRVTAGGSVTSKFNNERFDFTNYNLHPEGYYKVYTPNSAPETLSVTTYFKVYVSNAVIGNGTGNFEVGKKSGIVLPVCITDIGLITNTLNANEDTIFYKSNTSKSCSFTYKSDPSSAEVLVATGTIWHLFLESKIDDVYILNRNLENTDYSLAPAYPSTDDSDQSVTEILVGYSFQFMLANGTDSDIYLRGLTPFLLGKEGENGTFAQNMYDDQIRDGIRDPDSEYQSIFDVIRRLPSIILNSISTALQNLFVPSEQQIQQIINESRNLSENFGFIGQSFDFFISIFTDSMNLSQANGCATFPDVKLGNNTLFNEVTLLSSRRVCMSDNPIISNNINVIRSITTIALVSLFVSWAARNIFHVLSKSSDIANVNIKERGDD